ncbi:bifunctional biotin--[acetyl-CoA-carboxylase] ligase/biotin operon repressor BirA [Pseudoxanthomonas winnipegensis]|uniref:bifunctional biotin--[acetyl-CoA-carboxylase] ligase/biotin operon repressor BirA n=1 Tax=Pseudoxanthomonas winnipegensis TaxID=2480810 RepID=UPI001039E749|nr:bifunctional biotin--[acetyl-CoA-carboxylase] ligase/biotin operon repressor BirA [Pseudoxanthomonas winnipegensis]TBV74417.1 bifunctional biotin--[acetyl-CoA-carboxylase] ligase/biotin operon repressor BirA [Pseudoxanthomonas winnipegensis]
MTALPVQSPASAERERQLLSRLMQGPVSGDLLAQETGLTRTAIWKRVQALREAGIAIAGSAGQGYALQGPLELLDADALRAKLPAQALALVAQLEVAWSLDSTNSELLRRTSPDHGCAVLLAERQTGGRGRRGRSWASPLAAHIYLSVARRYSGGLARLGGLSLVAGVAVAEALRALGLAQVGLKWPNDLAVDGRKLGGLLVEGGGEAGGPVRAVVGIGLNVRMPQAQGEAIDQPWIDLAGALPTPPARQAVVVAVLAQLLPALALFDSEGLAPFLPRYAALDALRGRAVTVKLDEGNVAGTAEGIAEDGALRVATAQGLRVFHAGEVSVRAA